MLASARGMDICKDGGRTTRDLEPELVGLDAEDPLASSQAHENGLHGVARVGAQHHEAAFVRLLPCNCRQHLRQSLRTNSDTALHTLWSRTTLVTGYASQAARVCPL